jgi:hypothetical protein
VEGRVAVVEVVEEESYGCVMGGTESGADEWEEGKEGWIH